MDGVRPSVFIYTLGMYMAIGEPCAFIFRHDSSNYCTASCYKVGFCSRESKSTTHAAHTPSASHRACSARCEFHSRKPVFGCKQLSDWFLLSRCQKPAYTPPPRLRRRVALDQRDASLTRKSLPSVASNYQTGFRYQGIKSRRTRRRLLMDYTFCILGYLR